MFLPNTTSQACPTPKKKKQSLKNLHPDQLRQAKAKSKIREETTINLQNCMYPNCNLSTRLVKFYQNFKTFRDEPKCPPERERPRTCLSGEEEESGDVVNWQTLDLQSLESVSMI
jgi:hypothetical protein